VTVLGCANPSTDPDLSSELEERLRAGFDRPPGTEFQVPPEVRLDDGLSENEAVALALWNEPRFREALVGLEVAEADLWQAGLLPNPVLRLFFPLDVKQFEGTMAWALDALWTRPWRVASARNVWGETAQRLVETGLQTASATRLAFIDARFGEGSADLAQRRARLSERFAAIVAARAKRGEVIEFQAASRRADALRAREDAVAARQRADRARMALRAAVGADEMLPALELGRARELEEPPDAEEAKLRALETRPAILAARLRVDAAAEQIGLAKRSVVRLGVVVDSNQKGANGWEVGPGLDVEIPLFDRNQAGIARAEASLEQAEWAYAGERRRVSIEVATAHRVYADALGAVERWTAEAIPAVIRRAELARRAEQQGSIPYTDLITAELQLVDAEIRALDLETAARRALVDLERGIGRRFDE